MKKVPRFRSDEDAEAFLDGDLSGLDFGQFKPARFEFEAKSAQVNLRLPQSLLDAVKARAEARRMPYTRLIREVLEREVSTAAKARIG